MTYEIITCLRCGNYGRQAHEDLLPTSRLRQAGQKFRLQLLGDLTRMMPACRSGGEGRSGAVQPQSNKEWLRSSEVRKLLGISHGTLQNLRIKNILPHRKIGGLMYYKYQDILKLLEGGEEKTIGYGKAA